MLSEQLCAGLCDTIFTVSSTLIWAVLTGQTDWVCHIGTLTVCVEAVAWSCIIVTWWSGSGGIQAWSQRPTGFLQCFDTVDLVIWPVKNRLRNYLLCVEWDVKPYTLTHSMLKCSQPLLTCRCITFARTSMSRLLSLFTIPALSIFNSDFLPFYIRWSQ